MESKEEGEETVTKENEWEVVSLTELAYAAAPGPKEGDSGNDIHDKLGGQNEAETSTAMFMSGHFGFPPSLDENLPFGPEDREIHNEKAGEYGVTQLTSGEGKSDSKDEENVIIEGLIPDEFSPGIPIFDGNDSTLSIHCTNFDKDVAFVKEKSIYSVTEFDSIYSETTLVNSNTTGKDEILDGTVDSSIEKSTDGDNDAEFPYEAWWKRRVASFYSHAKEANTFWSICIAAAVMGLVIIGHRWQQDRLKILHKWQSNNKDERMGLLRGQIYRLKDVIVCGHRRGSLTRGSNST